jgi:hypothetical protein
MLASNRATFTVSTDTPEARSRYSAERRLVAGHPLTDAVLRHGARTLQAIGRLRLVANPDATTTAVLDDLERLTYRLAAKTHRTVAALIRVELGADDDGGGRREAEGTSQVMRLVLQEMCQAWTAIFLAASPDETLMTDLREGFVEVEQHLKALTGTPGSDDALPGRRAGL